MAENSIAKLKAKRSSIKGKLTRFENYLRGVNPDELNDTIINEIQARLNKLEPIYDEFDELQSEIEQQIIENQMQSETESQSAEAERNEFENRYFKLVGEMNALLNEHNNMNDNVSNNGTPQGSVRGSSHSVALQQNNNSLQSVVRLPPIKLPEFDGQYSNWLEFKDSFNALVDGNLALNNVQKFYYLRSSLGKEVLNIIKSLEVTDTNYDIAWQILKERFENKGLIIHNHIRAIFEHPSISKESYTDLRNLFDAVTKHLRALKSLGESTDSWDRLIIYIMCSKFDNTTRRDWEAFKCVGELPTINDLNSFLKSKCEVLEKLEVAKLDLSKYNSSKTLNKKGKEFSANYAATEKTYNNKFKCYFCNQTSHGIYKCNSFLKLPVAERIHAVKERKLCLNCFTDTHPSWKCSKSKCNKCHKAHNSILHLDFYKNSSNQNTSSAHGANNISQTQAINSTNGASGATSAGPHQEDSSTCSFNAEQCEVAGCTERGPDVGKTELAASATSKYAQVLLSTAIIKISNDNGKTITARALLDSGSQSNFISKHICNELNLNEVQINHAVKGVGQTLTNINHKVNVRIESCINKFYTNIDCLVIPSITERLPTISFKKNILKIPNLELADPNFNISGEIDILLGSNIFWTILGSNQVRLGPKMPTLHESKFGYIIAGNLNLKGILTESEASLSCLNILDSDNSIDSKIVKFWEIEEVNYKIDSMSESEKHCEKFFHDTTTRDHSGKFIVRIPFNKNLKYLGDSHKMAFNRFLALEQRLNKNSNLKTEYSKFMNEYEQLGHMSEIKDTEGEGYYLPHHAVLKASSLTTKCRVVFDASAKSTSGYSLNDVQYCGPTLQQDVFSILSRFRTYSYVMTGDINKMYRQIIVDSKETKYQKIFWRSEFDQDIKVFKLNTVTYGTASAPYLAVRCLIQIANDNEITYPLASKVIKRDFYMDDLLTGSNSLSELLELQRAVVKLLAKYGFELRKFLCNKKELLNEFHVNEGLDANILNIGENESNKTLGVYWDANNDYIVYKINIIKNSKIGFHLFVKLYL